MSGCSEENIRTQTLLLFEFRRCLFKWQNCDSGSGFIIRSIIYLMEDYLGLK